MHMYICERLHVNQSALNGLCALLCLRTQDFLRLLLRGGAWASAITIPGAGPSGPGRGACVRRFRFAAIFVRLGMRVRTDGNRFVFVILQAHFVPCEGDFGCYLYALLALHALAVASFAMYTRVLRSRCIAMWILCDYRCSSNTPVWVCHG